MHTVTMRELAVQRPSLNPDTTGWAPIDFLTVLPVPTVPMQGQQWRTAGSVFLWFQENRSSKTAAHLALSQRDFWGFSTRLRILTFFPSKHLKKKIRKV